MPVVGNFTTRYRVRSAGKKWTDKGPDLLRTRQSARRQLAAILHDKDGPFSVNGDRVGPRAEVMKSFAKWKGAEFRVTTNDLVAVVVRVRIPMKLLAHCSPGTSLAWSLTSYQFGDALFAGGYVYKQVQGSDSWSDHAWGTAFDITQHGDDTCRRITDWTARMAGANCLTFDYALGTLNGKDVVYVNADGDTRPSSAADSHLWHLHESVVDHDGRKPPHEGGAW